MKGKGKSLLAACLAGVILWTCSVAGMVRKTEQWTEGSRIFRPAESNVMSGLLKKAGEKKTRTAGSPRRSDQVEKKYDYGVFLGLTAKDLNKKAVLDQLAGYRLVVVEPEECGPSQLAALQEAGTQVYCYLNVGALENYRSYFKKYKKYALASYENWEDEYWVDVSRKKWQDFLVKKLAKKYADQGYDGFHLDNTDVYDHYHKQKIYKGLCRILQGLASYDVKLLVNGGDVFVKRTIKEGKASGLFDGIVQEGVFTAYNFQTESYQRQKQADHKYFIKYLAKAKEAGLEVYLIEYGAGNSLQEEIEDYCREQGYLWYDAADIGLGLG